MSQCNLLTGLRATSRLSALLFSVGFLSTNLAQAAITPEGLQAIKAVQFNSQQVITAGLPSEAEFVQLAASGVDVVINLIPDGNPNGHTDEASLVKQAGMIYEHISVDWQQPKMADVTRFFDMMDAHKDKDILVHCAANYRASAFYYLYQIKQGAADNLAFKKDVLAPWGDVEKIQQEYPQWHALIENIKAAYPH